MERLVLSVCTT